jgi:hypothetical protein
VKITELFIRRAIALGRDQQQQIPPAIAVDFVPNWQFSFGVGLA